MDIRTDLMKHFGAGMLIAVIVGIVAYCTNGNWLNVLLTSALCGVVETLQRNTPTKHTVALGIGVMSELAHWVHCSAVQ